MKNVPSSWRYICCMENNPQFYLSSHSVSQFAQTQVAVITFLRKTVRRLEGMRSIVNKNSLLSQKWLFDLNFPVTLSKRGLQGWQKGPIPRGGFPKLDTARCVIFWDKLLSLFLQRECKVWNWMCSSHESPKRVNFFNCLRLVWR